MTDRSALALSVAVLLLGLALVWNAASTQSPCEIRMKFPGNAISDYLAVTGKDRV